MQDNRVKQAVFLVGGRGTRLGGITKFTPKPLLEIAPGMRFLDVLLESAARRGFTNILLLAGFMGEQVESVYDGKEILGAKIKVMREPEPQGTGGALAFAKSELEPFFVLSNGDSWFDINLRALTMELGVNSMARMALREIDDTSRYGRVEVSDGIITGFQEKDASLGGPALINGGIYFMRRELVDLIEGPCSIENELFPQLVREGRLEGEEHSGFFLDIGLPETYDEAKNSVPANRFRPCAFLDRDGVLNHDQGYTYRVEDLKWIDGAQKAVRVLNDAGYYVIVVTNQSGVARGFYSLSDVETFHSEIQSQLALHGAYIDAFYTCPFHADGVVQKYRRSNHPDRKPNPGMLLQAAKEWPIDMSRSFIIGDKKSDVEAGVASGIPGHLFSGGRLDELIASLL